MEIKGVPPRSIIVLASRRGQFFDEDYRPLLTLNSKGKKRIPGSLSLSKLMK